MEVVSSQAVDPVEVAEPAPIDELFDANLWEVWSADAVSWVEANVFTQATLIELGLVVAASLVALAMVSRFRESLAALGSKHRRYELLQRLWQKISSNAFAIVWLGLQFLIVFGARYLELRHTLLVLTTNLLGAWVVINIATTFVRNPSAARVIAVVAWTVAALNIAGYLDATTQFLDSLALNLGTVSISALTVIQAIITLAVLLWVTNIATQVIESRINLSPSLSPSVQVLSGKLVRIGLVTVALLASLSIVGVDLTALAVLGGAIGVGLGFGLQKIFANLVSGFILLLEKSIKPGDVIEVAGYYGRVDSLGARYVSVYTRDGIEHLIPNEDLIVNRVENWSYSQNLLRLRKVVGAHYKSDIHKAIELCLEAAAETPRILDDPKPVCLMKDFGESSVDLEVRFWINDPMNGRAGVASEILRRVWHSFAEHGIEIPYPQRDIHLRTPDVPDLDAVRKALGS